MNVYLTRNGQKFKKILRRANLGAVHAAKPDAHKGPLGERKSLAAKARLEGNRLDKARARTS